jgi:hypothetical protein
MKKYSDKKIKSDLIQDMRENHEIQKTPKGNYAANIEDMNEYQITEEVEEEGSNYGVPTISEVIEEEGTKPISHPSDNCKNCLNSFSTKVSLEF